MRRRLRRPDQASRIQLTANVDTAPLHAYREAADIDTAPAGATPVRKPAPGPADTGWAVENITRANRRPAYEGTQPVAGFVREGSSQAVTC